MSKVLPTGGEDLKEEVGKGEAVKEGEEVSALIDVEEEDGGTRFSLHQFLQQLVIQLLYPISLVPAALFISPGYALNMLGLGSPIKPLSLIPATLFLAFNLCPFVVLPAFALSTQNAHGWVAATIRSDALHVLIATLCLRLTISMKYAFLPTAAYARRLRCHAPTSELAAEQLVTGWFRIDQATITREVGASVALRYPHAPQEAFEVSPQSLPRLLAVLRSPGARGQLWGVVPPLSTPRIPVEALVNAIMVEVVVREGRYATRLQRLLFAIALLGTFTTTIVRAAVGSPAFGATVAEGLVIVGHWVSNVMVMGVTFTFLAIGAIDHRRRARSHRLLGDLFKPGARGRPPALTFHTTHQARAFLTARNLLLVFGEAFHERLVLVISASLVVFAALSAYCLASLYTASSVSIVVSSMILLHVLVLPAFVCTALGLHEAASVNELLRKHVALVVEARVHWRLARDGGDSSASTSGTSPTDGACGAPLPPHHANPEEDARLLGLLEDVERQMVEQQFTRPVTILGITATDSLTNSFVGVWVSLETAALTVAYLWATSGGTAK